jgi:tripartite ATP-independent transporter DctP family solute receptor
MKTVGAVLSILKVLVMPFFQKRPVFRESFIILKKSYGDLSCFFARQVLIGLLLIVGMIPITSCDKSQDEKKVIEFKVAHSLTKNTHTHKGLEYFCKLVRERSDGVLQPKLYSGGELGDSRSLLEGLRLGTVQMVSTAVAPLSAFDSKLMLCDLPFIFKDHEQAEKVLDGTIGQQIAADLPAKAKIRVLAYWVSGFRSVFNSKKPIRTIDDLKEMKIRVMETPVHIDTFKALGAIPTPMSFGELYTSLAQGVVDGAENDADAFWSQGFYETCKYYSLTKHSYTAIPLVISEKYYQSLNPDMQQIIQQAAYDARDYERNIARRMNDAAIEKLRAEGIHINSVDTKPFKNAMKPVYRKYEKVIGAKILHAVIEY